MQRLHGALHLDLPDSEKYPAVGYVFLHLSYLPQIQLRTGGMGEVGPFGT